MLAPKVVLTLLCIVQGVIPFFYYTTIIDIFRTSHGSVFYETFRHFNFAQYIDAPFMGISVAGAPGVSASIAVPFVMIILFAGAFIIAKALRGSGGSEEREAETWLCGYQDLHNLNRYKDSSMFAALKNYLWWTGGNVKK